jgi:DNA-binding XRE family transcriptional regulator
MRCKKDEARMQQLEPEKRTSENARRSNRVREIREERLMTREELAERAGLSLRTVWSVENGFPCRLPTKRRILRGLRLAKIHHRLVFPNG